MVRRELASDEPRSFDTLERRLSVIKLNPAPRVEIEATVSLAQLISLGGFESPSSDAWPINSRLGREKKPRFC